MKNASKIMLVSFLVLVFLTAGFSLFAGGDKDEKAGKSKGPITIFWAEWDPANYLQELCNIYTEETGVQVNVETTPWGDFQTKTFNELAARGDAYDIVVGDSQWLGAGATQGHYVELTDWMKERGVDESMSSTTIVGYSEYPKASGRYWSVPLEGDACGWAYRKDLFEDPDEMAAFQEEYGYELDVPDTWDQLRDIAEFFYRPDENFYGVAVYTQKDYDAITMGIENVLWAWGADLGDPATYKVDGILNTPQGIQALQFYKELYSYCPPDWGNVFFMQNNQAMAEGLVAMTMNYFAFLPALVNPEMSKFADSTGFFSMPEGPGGRWAALGGQGASIISYSEKQDLCFDWLDWFVQADTQAKWAELGGYTCHLETLKSEEFLNATPYNRAFMETMQMVKDFWAVPEYAQLLEVCQRWWHGYVVADQWSANDAMDGIAEEWEQIFEQYGYYD